MSKICCSSVASGCSKPAQANHSHTERKKFVIRRCHPGWPKPAQANHSHTEWEKFAVRRCPPGWPRPAQANHNHTEWKKLAIRRYPQARPDLNKPTPPLRNGKSLLFVGALRPERPGTSLTTPLQNKKSLLLVGSAPARPSRRRPEQVPPARTPRKEAITTHPPPNTPIYSITQPPPCML